MKTRSTYHSRTLVLGFLTGLCLLVAASGWAGEDPSLEELKSERQAELNQKAKQAAAQKKARAEAEARRLVEARRKAAAESNETFQPAPHSGPSFNCHKASTFVEKAVCASQRLSSLDNKLGYLYQKARNNLSRSQFEMLRSEQRQWLKYRDGQIASECIRGNGLDIECTANYWIYRIAEIESRYGIEND